MAPTDARLAEIRARHTHQDVTDLADEIERLAAQHDRAMAITKAHFQRRTEQLTARAQKAEAERDALRAELAALQAQNTQTEANFDTYATDTVLREGELRGEAERLRAHILDIDAHATPYGDIPDDPGYVGTYLVTAGALHRALGKVGHCAPSCQAEAERDETLAKLAAVEQDAARWRRVEPLIERSHRHDYHLDPVDLLNVAADDTEEATSDE